MRENQAGKKSREKVFQVEGPQAFVKHQVRDSMAQVVGMASGTLGSKIQAGRGLREKVRKMSRSSS